VEAQGDPKLSYTVSDIRNTSREEASSYYSFIHGRFLVLLILLGNLNSAAFVVASISNFGFDETE